MIQNSHVAEQNKKITFSTMTSIRDSEDFKRERNLKNYN